MDLNNDSKLDASELSAALAYMDTLDTKDGKIGANGYEKFISKMDINDTGRAELWKQHQNLFKRTDEE